MLRTYGKGIYKNMYVCMFVAVYEFMNMNVYS
jgi:hypothetical protein